MGGEVATTALRLDNPNVLDPLNHPLDAGSDPGALTLGHPREESREAAALFVEQGSPCARLERHRRGHRCRTEAKDHRVAQERSDMGDSRAGTARRGGECQAIGVAFPGGVTDRAKRRSARPLVRPDQLALRSCGADAQLLGRFLGPVIAGLDDLADCLGSARNVAASYSASRSSRTRCRPTRIGAARSTSSWSCSRSSKPLGDPRRAVARRAMSSQRVRGTRSARSGHWSEAAGGAERWVAVREWRGWRRGSEGRGK